MEDHMPESTPSAGDAAPPVTEDEAIHERVKGLTRQVLRFCSRAGSTPMLSETLSAP
jgi:hypothetical protein